VVGNSVGIFEGVGIGLDDGLPDGCVVGIFVIGSVVGIFVIPGARGDRVGFNIGYSYQFKNVFKLKGPSNLWEIHYLLAKQKDYQMEEHLGLSLPVQWWL